MKKQVEALESDIAGRRKILKLTATLGTIASFLPLAGFISTARAAARIIPKAFVYTELQISMPFNQVPWKDLNKTISAQVGFINKTWLSGVGNNSVGGFYAFDSIENAQKFVVDFLPALSQKLGVAQISRVFDASVTEQASRGINSAHYANSVEYKPGAFVYTEVQLNIPFEKAPWRKRNPVLVQQKGLLSKTWLSGLHTNTIGGLDVFDSLQNAMAFALNDFPRLAKKLNSAFCTRVFDANITKEASHQMHSPFYR